MGKDESLAELTEAALTMIQGSLSEVTRQCGDPSCACAWDRQRRHGPHLYLKFSTDGKAHSVYVSPDHAPTLRDSHQAWLRFQQLGTELAGVNRERFLRSLERDKQRAKARRAKARAKSSR
jgi:C-terminal processing protease CtpA/Prc